MLAQVKKLAGNDLAGRFGAWWDGRDYVPPAQDSATGDTPDPSSKGAQSPDAEPASVTKEVARIGKPKAVKKTDKRNTRKSAPTDTGDIPEPAQQKPDGAQVRIKALETLWGEGRFAPGSFALDAMLIDTLLATSERPGDIGFIGVDGALLNTFLGQSDRKALVTEWRQACVSRLAELAPSAQLTAGEVDRPRGFHEASLPAVLSVEAFAYADHKTGLVGRVHRALNENGRWVFLDTTRSTKKTPPEAFASAWAEPQLATNDEIHELLELAGFRTVHRACVSELVLASARQGYANLSSILENAARNGLKGREGALFLQELAWEAQSWRARCRALEGGALEMNLWVADKTERVARSRLPEGALPLSRGLQDAEVAKALFE